MTELRLTGAWIREHPHKQRHTVDFGLNLEFGADNTVSCRLEQNMTPLQVARALHLTANDIERRYGVVQNLTRARSWV